MEDVDGMMNRLRLSAAEKKGIKIGGSGGKKGVSAAPMAFGKVLSDRLESGKRHALDEGPWMFGKDLVIMVEFEGEKTLEEVEFNFIPIWVRVFKLPFGLMNKETGEAIGQEIGEFMGMDKDEDGSALGKFLRVKVCSRRIAPGAEH
uniref:Uncharacterized protein n=1 Tax=Leersia perrieri TaxID=77586 RepID=A0A0D9X3E7_9ORYZ